MVRTLFKHLVQSLAAGHALLFEEAHRGLFHGLQLDDEVAQRIEDRAALVNFDRAEHMRPRADDGVRARVDAAVRKFHAELRRLALYRAHALVRVDGHDHIVGHEARLADHFFRAGHVGLVHAGADARLVRARDAHGAELRRTVGQLREIALRAFQLAVGVEIQRGRDLAQLRELRLRQLIPGVEPEAVQARTPRHGARLLARHRVGIERRARADHGIAPAGRVQIDGRCGLGQRTARAAGGQARRLQVFQGLQQSRVGIVHGMVVRRGQHVEAEFLHAVQHARLRTEPAPAGQRRAVGLKVVDRRLQIQKPELALRDKIPQRFKALIVSRQLPEDHRVACGGTFHDGHLRFLPFLRGFSMEVVSSPRFLRSRRPQSAARRALPSGAAPPAAPAAGASGTVRPPHAPPRGA